MCYSAMIKADVKRLSRLFRSSADYDAFMKLNLDRLKDPSLKIPVGLDRYFVLSQDPSESRLAGPIRQFYEEEKTRVQAEIKLVENEIREFSSSKPTAAIKKKVETRERKLEKLRRKLEFSFDRISPLDERIFPGYFAPVILNRGEKRVIVPMRYRVRRPDGGEVPYQYNVFNARRDSLLTAPTWKPLFGQSHAIFPFTKFFEWVEREDKKREISFVPESRTMMWAAALYSEPQDKSYRSFAMVTDEPPPEVAEAGHDRCPIFLSEEHIDAWLEPKGKSKEYLLSLLDHKEKTYYSHSLVA